MSTRARIGIVNADSSIASIYTHNDGYVSHHGPILLNHYNTEAKIRKLLKLGSLSTLGEELGEKHNFNDSYKLHPDWCCAYGRDRGEANVSPRKNKTMALFNRVAEECGAEYAYLFNQGKWSVSKVRDTEPADWKDLLLETVTERLTS